MNKSNSLQNPKTVSIVGGGIGGLASAILLAKQGYKVSLYEKNECLGGRASIMHKDGYTFDMGPSRYLMPDIFEEFFESIDEDIHEYLDLKQLSPSYRVFYNDKQTQNQIQITTYNGKICCNNIGLFGYNKTEEKIKNGVLAIIKNTQTGKFLLQVKKKAYNIITLCGGGVEEGENCEDTIIREIKEETGLLYPKIITKLGDSTYLRYRKGNTNLFGANDFYYIEVESDTADSVSSEEQDKNGNIWLDEQEVAQSISFYSHLIGWFRYKEWIGGSKDRDRADKEFIQYIQISGFGCKDVPRARPQTNTSLQHLDIYADSKRMSDIFESMEPGAGKQFLTFLDRAKIQYEIGMEFCKKNYDSIFDFFRRDIMRKGIKLNIRTTIDRYVARFFKNQLIRKIMQYTTVFLGTAPKQTPALYNIMSHCDFNMGVRYPKGGLHEIAKALHQIGLKNGVEYHLDTEVVGCEIKDNQIKSLKVKQKKKEIITLNFYDQNSWDMITSRNKSVETRALNPEEPERYLGNIEIGNELVFLNKHTGEKIKVKVRKKYLWENFEDLAKESKGVLESIRPDKKEYNLQDADFLKSIWNFTPDYVDRVEKNGLVGWEFEIVSKHQTIQSDIYLINADMAWFETQIIPLSHQTYPLSYRNKKIFAPSGFIIYAGVNKKLPKLDHHNLYFCEDRDKNFGQVFDTKELPTDPSIYVSKITHTDPSMAPEGCENLFILVPIPNGIEISNSQKDQYKNMVRKIVEQMAGEEIVGHLAVEEIFTVDDFKSRYNSWQGTALGLAHPIMQTAVFRANNISKKLDNLFYVGHNTNPGIGVPMVIISAQLALERVQKRDTLNQK